jgi:hypothetical protein
MRRPLVWVAPREHSACWCCPGHDKFPTETYRNRRSKHARARDRQIENQLVRTIQKRTLKHAVDQGNYYGNY